MVEMQQCRPDEVYIWWAATDMPDSAITSLAALLTEEEKRRADRFVDPRHRSRFIAAHGRLRQILGRCLAVPPEHVPVVQGDNGKPRLDPPYDNLLHFNLSHSAGMVLLGVSKNRRIGVDIEYIRPLENMATIARRYFTQDEYTRIMSAPQSLQENAFYTLWSMKEACLKCSGQGLPGLDALKLDIHEADACRIISAAYVDEGSHTWSIRTLDRIAGYAAAVAVEHDFNWTLKYRYRY